MQRPNVKGFRNEAVQEAMNLQRYFSKIGKPAFIVEKIVGEGTGGFALKITTSSRPAKVFVMKRALAKQQEKSLRQEITILTVCYIPIL